MIVPKLLLKRGCRTNPHEVVRRGNQSDRKSVSPYVYAVKCSAKKKDATHYKLHPLGRTGLERNNITPCPSNELQEARKSGGAFSAISVAAELLSDPNFQFLLASWAKLPEPIKTGILSIVKGSIDK